MYNKYVSYAHTHTHTHTNTHTHTHKHTHTVPLPTYFICGAEAHSALVDALPNGGEVCTNLTYLGTVYMCSY